MTTWRPSQDEKERNSRAVRSMIPGSLDGRVVQARPVSLSTTFSLLFAEDDDDLDDDLDVNNEGNVEEYHWYVDTFIVKTLGNQLIELSYVPVNYSPEVYYGGMYIPESNWSMFGDHSIELLDPEHRYHVGRKLSVNYVWKDEFTPDPIKPDIVIDVPALHVDNSNVEFPVSDSDWISEPDPTFATELVLQFASDVISIGSYGEGPNLVNLPDTPTGYELTRATYVVQAFRQGVETLVDPNDWLPDTPLPTSAPFLMIDTSADGYNRTIDPLPDIGGPEIEWPGNDIDAILADLPANRIWIQSYEDMPCYVSYAAVRLTYSALVAAPPPPYDPDAGGNKDEEGGGDNTDPPPDDDSGGGSPVAPGDKVGMPDPGTMYLGVSKLVDGREAYMGQRMGAHRTFWNDSSSSTTSAIASAKTDINTGRVPWQSFKLGVTWAQAASGLRDDWLNNLCVKYTAIGGGPIPLTIHHEPNGDGQSNLDYLAMYARFKTITDLYPRIWLTPNLSAGYFQMNGGGWRTVDWFDPDSADMFSLDCYNPSSPSNTKAFTTADQTFRLGGIAQCLAQDPTKPIGIAEWGVRTKTGDASAASNYMDDAYEYCIDHNVIIMTYFDSGLNSPDGTWELDKNYLGTLESPANRKTKFKELLTDPRSVLIPPGGIS